VLLLLLLLLLLDSSDFFSSTSGAAASTDIAAVEKPRELNALTHGGVMASAGTLLPNNDDKLDDERGSRPAEVRTSCWQCTHPLEAIRWSMVAGF